VARVPESPHIAATIARNQHTAEEKTSWRACESRSRRSAGRWRWWTPGSPPPRWPTAPRSAPRTRTSMLW